MTNNIATRLLYFFLQTWQPLELVKYGGCLFYGIYRVGGWLYKSHGMTWSERTPFFTSEIHITSVTTASLKPLIVAVIVALFCNHYETLQIWNTWYCNFWISCTTGTDFFFQKKLMSDLAGKYNTCTFCTFFLLDLSSYVIVNLSIPVYRRLCLWRYT